MADARLLLALSLALAACGQAPATESGTTEDAVPVKEARAPSAPPAPSARPARPARSAPPMVANGEAFTCTPTKVWDGDGPIHCAEGPKVRLAGIAAREMDGSCRPGHPCPDASAEEARDALAVLLGGSIGTASTGHLLIEGPALECMSQGSGKGSRTAAWCVSPDEGDLSCAMVASGMAQKWDRYWRDEACA